MKAIELPPEARLEFLEAIKFYSSYEPELGERFREEIERLLNEVRADPSKFPFVSHSFRHHFSQKFPFGIIYRGEESIQVIAVMHLRRKPRYWRKRLNPG